MRLDTLQFVCVAKMDHPAGWLFEPHNHSFHEMVLMLRGKMDVRVPQGTFHANPRDVFFFPAGTMHEETPAPADLPQTVYWGFTCDEDLSAIPPQTEDSEGRIFQLVNWLVNSRDCGLMSRSDASSIYARAIVSEVLQLANQPDGTLVATVRRYINSHIGETIRLDDLAHQVRMSKYHFLRRYCKAAGRTPMEDVQAMRVDKARDYLVNTGLPLKAIATRVGIANEYHLSRLFRRFLNVTPRDVRGAHSRRFFPPPQTGKGE